MKKIFSMFVIIMIVGTMFAGCDNKEVVAEKTDGFIKEIEVNGIVVEEIIVEDIIVEDIIVEDVITWDDVNNGWD